MNNRVSVLGLAKLEGVAMAALGLLAGIVYSVGGLFHDLLFMGGLNYGTALAFGALIGMPAIGGAVGVVAGVVHAVVLNFIGRFLPINLDIRT